MLNFYDDIQIAPVKYVRTMSFISFSRWEKFRGRPQRQIEITAVHTANLRADGNAIFIDFCAAKPSYLLPRETPLIRPLQSNVRKFRGYGKTYFCTSFTPRYPRVIHIGIAIPFIFADFDYGLWITDKRQWLPIIIRWSRCIRAGAPVCRTNGEWNLYPTPRRIGDLM